MDETCDLGKMSMYRDIMSTGTWFHLHSSSNETRSLIRLGKEELEGVSFSKTCFKSLFTQKTPFWC